MFLGAVRRFWERCGTPRRYKDRAGDIPLMVGVLGAVRSFGRDAARHVATKNTVSIEVSIPLRVLREKMPRSPRVHRP